MRQQLRHTAILGSGSFATIAVGLVAAKTYAVLLGPSGLGTMALLQALVAFAAPLAGAGVATVVIRELAYSLERSDASRVDVVRIAAFRVLVILAFVAASVLIAGREAIAAVLLGPAGDPAMIAASAGAVIATIMTGLWMGVVNGYRRVGRLAGTAAASSVASALASVVVILLGGPAWIAGAVVAGSVAAAVVAYASMRGSVPAVRHGAGAATTLEARHLVATGVPLAIGTMIAGSVQLAVPVLVLHSLGADAVGFYRAAAAISIGYLGFLVTAMSQDYYPRLSAVADSPRALADTAYQQQRLIVAIALPVVMIAIAAVPLLVRLLYTDAFAPASDMLETQLIGDLLKLPSWAFAFVLIVEQRRRAYVANEIVAAVVLVVGVVVGLTTVGLAGVGLAYLVTYAVYYPVTYLIVRRTVPLRLDAAVQGPILFAFVASVGTVALGWLGVPWLRLPAALAGAVVTSMLSLRVLAGELGGPWRTWRPGRA